MTATDVDLGAVLMELAKHPATLQRFLESLNAHDLAIAEDVLGERFALGWRSNPVAMAHHLAPTEVELYPYSVLLGRKFADAVEGRSKRQIWNVPARYGKSMIASKWGPAWCLDRNPNAKIILSSYAYNLARENAVAVRDILRGHADVLRARLRTDVQRADRFMTPEGGGVLAAGMAGQITGFGAGSGGGVVIDDPFKDWVEAHSENARDRVWERYRGTFRLRLDDDDAWIIVVHTRWHEDDLTGKLLAQMGSDEGEDWELIRIPALAERHDPASPDPLIRLPDPLGREVGEPIEARRFSKEAVQARASVLGSYLAAALEQQRPAPEEGGEIERGWWRWESAFPPGFDTSITSWDMKLKDKEAGDFVVGQAWGRTGGDFWLRGQLRGQWNQATTKLAIALMSVRFPDIERHYIENTGNGPEVMRELRTGSKRYVVSDELASKLGMTDAERVEVQAVMRRGMSGLLPVNVKGDKRVRLRAQSGVIEAGQVHLPADTDFALSLVNEAAAFPNGDHDDQVDALSQALAKLRVSEGSIKGPAVGAVPKPTAGARSQPAPRSARASVSRPAPRRRRGPR